MERVAHLVNTIGKDIKLYGGFRKTSSAESARTVSDFILSYIDETTKKGVTEEGKAIKDYDELARGQKQNLIEGIDYLTKEQRGTLKPYGFLRDDIAKHVGVVPLHMTNRERIEAAHLVYMERLKLKQTKYYGHKFILTLDPRMCEIINASGKSVDEHMTQFVRSVFRRYQEKFYPDERIGYLMGIHHDRKHIHAHILLFPTTESGKVLAVTDGGRRKDLGEKRARPHKFMQKLANNLVEKFYQKEFVNPIRASQRPVSEVIQKKLLTRVALSNVEKALSADGKDDIDNKVKWQRVIHEKKRIEGLPEDERRLLLIQAYDAEIVKFGTMTKFVSKKENAGKATEQVANSMQGQRESLDKLTKRFKTLNERKEVIAEQRKAMIADLAMWKKLRVLGRTVRVGTYGFRESEVGKWFYSRMAADDDFGKLLRQPEFAHLLNKPMDEAEENEMLRNWQSKADMDRAKALGSKHMREVLAANRVYKAHLTPLWLKSREEDYIKKYLKEKYKELNEKFSEIHDEKRGVLQEIDQVKAKMQIVTLDKLLLKSAINNKKPQYLQQYEGWKVAGTRMPVLVGGNDKVTPELLVQDKQRETVGNSFEEVNKRVQKILDRVDKARGTMVTAVELENEFKITLGEAEKITGLKKDVLLEKYRALKQGKQGRALEVFFTPKKDTLIRRTRSSIDGVEKSTQELDDQVNDAEQGGV